MKRKLTEGFTLIELIIVIGIIAIILAFSISNLLGARGRARDARAKAELRELKTALRLYYNDYQNYPVSSGTDIQGCGLQIAPGPDVCAAGTIVCNGTSEAGEFVAYPSGGCANATLYMKRLPRNPANTDVSYEYGVNATRNDFCAIVPLENAADQDIAVSQSRCSGACTAAGMVPYGVNDYAMCAD
ncbi:hypothetical protein A2Z33_04265 [Candidatus Gottesmanbacteria bacterium RBG_16_52_11]|uniref:Type II secretion system protein GspG C-terminal domain-containing protein n=1 Tax=Candidatus Gottesmanbacteria bacterium RBG_16_52_11 TaxID=1798374 RepID=A0A1F5YW78_9BACT|nr:MAG: hypothetical protein A2Z33_04265 [Candidatus Gottesmanbacteria bacterium RBG_16_52_11]